MLRSVFKVLRDEPPQADPPAPEDVSIISEQEMVDWSPEQRKEHTEKLEKFYRYRRIKNTIDEDKAWVMDMLALL